MSVAFGLRVLLFLWFYLFTPLLFPFIWGVLPWLVPALKKRKTFEQKNRQGPGSNSFHLQSQKADAAFEVSSEGELEQIFPLLKNFLDQGLKLELIFCSPSVEKKCLELYQLFPDQLRILRLPLLSFFPGGLLPGSQTLKTWITAPQLFLCRYDFFPELLSLGLDPARRFYLLSASLKNKEKKLQRPGLLIYLWKKIYHSFDLIVAANEREKTKILRLLELPSEKVLSFDFRLLRIMERVDQAQKTLTSTPWGGSFLSFLEKIPREERMILGSLWPQELRAMELVPEQISKGLPQFLAAVPHVIDPLSLKEMQKILQEKLTPWGPPVYLLHDRLSAEEVANLFIQLEKRPGVLIMGVRGVLCELYSFFDHAFVGGGYGRSIHSVLEPFVAGCRVYCGPKTHRSTEFDDIQARAPGEVHVLQQPKDLFPEWSQRKSERIDREERWNLISQNSRFFSEFLSHYLHL